MVSTRNIDELAAALIDLVGAMNSPRQDDVLLREAGVSLDRALFPLLVCLSRSPAIGGAELAAQVGRDPSTVSRQVARLEALGLVQRQPGASDMRVKETVITASGAHTLASITQARRTLLGHLLRDWSREDQATLTRLMRRFADDMRDRQRDLR